VSGDRLVVVGDDPGLEIRMARAGGACAVGVLTGLATADSFARLRPDRNAHLVVAGVGDLLPYFERSSAPSRDLEQASG
jgi:NagD protein